MGFLLTVRTLYATNSLMGIDAEDQPIGGMQRHKMASLVIVVWGQADPTQGPTCEFGLFS